MSKSLVTRSRAAQVKEEFADWTLLTPEQRKLLGVPQNVADFARRKQVGERTVRRWQSEDDEFARLLEERRASTEAATTRVRTSLPALGDDSSIEGPFAFAWQRLPALIASGDKSALQMYLSSPLAKAVMEAQLEQARSDFAELSDDELAGRLLATLDDDEMAGELLRRGWLVERPAGEQA